MDKKTIENIFRSVFGSGGDSGGDNSENRNIVEEAFQRVFDERGHANVLIATFDHERIGLVDGLLQGDLLRSGLRRNISDGFQEITKEEFPLSLFQFYPAQNENSAEDIKGLEIALSKRDNDRKIHLAWLCIPAKSCDTEMQQEKLIAVLSKHNIPVVGVLTDSQEQPTLVSETRKALPDLRSVVMLRSVAGTKASDEIYDPLDMAELARISAEIIPKQDRLAFITTQKANCKLKHDYALQIVTNNALVAAGTGAIPVPALGELTLVPLQARMIAKVSSVYVISYSTGALSAMVTSLLGVAIATLTGRVVVSLLKAIPGVGTVAGGVISGATGAALTTGLGATYISILDALCKKKLGESPSGEEIVEEMEDRFGIKEEPEECKNPDQ